MPDALVWLGLILLGVAVGAYGTLIGAGGGFILTPLLLFLYPDYPPEVITAVSLAVVWFNASSGAIAYARQRRIDYLAALIFALATLPGAVLGAVATSALPRSTFEAVFGVVLVAVAVWLILPKPNRIVTTQRSRYIRRLLTDGHGDTYRYGFDPLLGIVLGLAIGFFSSLFGVGGGIVYVPAMILLLRFPAQIATATSTFTLVFTAAAGALVHVLAGHYADVIEETLALAAGVIIGAQAGAFISERLAGRNQALVTRLLSVALLLVSLRLLLGRLL